MGHGASRKTTEGEWETRWIGRVEHSEAGEDHYVGAEVILV